MDTAWLTAPRGGRSGGRCHRRAGRGGAARTSTFRISLIREEAGA